MSESDINKRTNKNIILRLYLPNKTIELNWLMWPSYKCLYFNRFWKKLKGIIVKIKQISGKYISHRIWIYLPTKTNTTVQTNTANSRVKYGGPTRCKISWYTINLFSKMINYILIRVIMRNFISTLQEFMQISFKKEFIQIWKVNGW